MKGSLNLFNHRTNVNVNNRIVCYDIKELGKQMKKLGIHPYGQLRYHQNICK
ncbi:MAG: hypothetical protein KHY02_08430 [Faecalibacterium prausnitzii]|nr:hypothetical protein [Faecalibacterium prausnitzii]